MSYQLIKNHKNQNRPVVQKKLNWHSQNKILSKYYIKYNCTKYK